MERTNNLAVPRVEHDHELLLQAWECAFAGARVIYLSGPITTGPRFVNWYRSVGKALERDDAQYSVSLREAVMRPNEADIRLTAQKLRVSLPFPIIEPASLSVHHWCQSDYHALWVRVIERFADRVVFMPGWQYSAGCAAEFEKTLERGIRAETLEGVEITRDLAIALLLEAAKKIEGAGAPISGVFAVASALRALEAHRANSIHPSLSPKPYFFRKMGH
jgi:hypothetical protein